MGSSHLYTERRIWLLVGTSHWHGRDTSTVNTPLLCRIRIQPLCRPHHGEIIQDILDRTIHSVQRLAVSLFYRVKHTVTRMFSVLVINWCFTSPSLTEPRGARSVYSGNYFVHLGNAFTVTSWQRTGPNQDAGTCACRLGCGHDVGSYSNSPGGCWLQLVLAPPRTAGR